MFAILGMSLLSQRMGYCEGAPSVYGVNKEDCLAKGFAWKKYSTSFDNIIEAMVSLFIISSLEGWPDIMLWAVDSNMSDTVQFHSKISTFKLYFIF